MTMRTVASIWQYERQGQNAQEIAGLAGDLCDKVSASVVDLNSVAEKIAGALDADNKAMKRLATGKGNALYIGERIRDLGVKTKRPMPEVLIDRVLTAAQGADAGGPGVYSRPASASPVCYDQDIIPKMVDDYRKRNGQ